MNSEPVARNENGERTPSANEIIINAMRQAAIDAAKIGEKVLDAFAQGRNRILKVQNMFARISDPNKGAEQDAKTKQGWNNRLGGVPQNTDGRVEALSRFGGLFSTPDAPSATI